MVCRPTVHYCNVLIRAHTRRGHGQQALLVFDRLLQHGFLPDKYSFANVLSVCGREKALDTGKSVHALAVSAGFDYDAIVATAILNLYGKCGILDDALKTFESLPEKDVVAWNTIIAACAHNGHGAECLQFFREMLQSCVLFDSYTCVSMLGACANLEDLKTGHYIHSWLSVVRPQQEVTLETALINMYSKCCRPENAREVFDEMAHHDVISWNTLISGYAQCGHTEKVFLILHRMMLQGMAPNAITYISIIDGCAAWASLSEGQVIYSCLMEAGLRVDVVLGSALVNMYCKCNFLHDALKVFDGSIERNLITWNSLIAGYVLQQQGEEALKLFDAMQDEGISPDRITWSTLLDACVDIESLAEGEVIYSGVVKVGLESNTSIAASAIKMYSKCGNLDISLIIFEKVSQQDFILWSAMLMVNTEHGFIAKTCELLHEMQESGFVPSSLSFADLIGACARKAALQEGQWTHSMVVLLAGDQDIFVSNAVVNMYGKCSRLEDAQVVFDGIQEKNSITWSTIIAAYAFSGINGLSVQYFTLMQKEDTIFDKVSFINLLDACAKQGILSEGQNLHTNIMYRGFDVDPMLANALINMYGECGDLDNAKAVFDNIATRDIVSWNTMIKTYAQQSDLVEALGCWDKMGKEGITPDELTYVSMLSACAGKENNFGLRWVHQCIVLGGFETSPSMAASLIKVYGKWGRLEDAQRLFDGMPNRNAMSWNAIIMAYTEQGRNIEAIQLFKHMQTEGVLGENSAYVCTLNAVSLPSFLMHGKHMHTYIISLGISSNIVVATALISMYGKCGSLEHASRVFHIMPERDVVSWNAIIGALLENKSYAGGFQLFDRMSMEALLPNSCTFLNILNTCIKCRALMDGKRVHCCLLFWSSMLDIGVTNTILSMYGECSNILDAQRIFNEIQERDVVSWNAIITVYAHAGHHQEAFQKFFQMEVEGLIPDAVTFVAVLNACGSLGSSSQGKSIHSRIMHSGFSHVNVNNSLVNMYSKCGHLQDAGTVFVEMLERNVASWNAIISAHCQWGDCQKALELFATMLAEVSPDAITFASVISACINTGALSEGKLLHDLIISLGLEQEVLVGNALISMYGRCGNLTEARRVYEKIRTKNVVTWNTMLMVVTVHGFTIEIIHLFEEMHSNEIIPNEVTFSSMLDFCACVGTTTRGQLFHMYIVHCGCEADVVIATSLVSMYGKCGTLEDALHVFKNVKEKNIFTYTAMIATYTCHGHGINAFLLLMQIQEQGLMVDEVTLVSILSACSHAGLLDMGQYCLFHMCSENMTDMQHLDCMIDSLGRMGQLVDAESLINTIPFQPTRISWVALLGACRYLGDLVRASLAVAHINELDPENSAACIMLSNTHNAAQYSEFHE